MVRTIQVSLAVLLLVASGAARAGDDEARNKEIVRQMAEAINERDFDALDHLVADDVRRHSAATPGVEVRSLEDFKAFLHQDLAAVPDARQEIQIMIAEGDKVALRAIYRGTQTGPMGPFPPSGKQVEIPFIGILRIEDGKIAELWVEWDNLAALTRLGHLPPPEADAAAAGVDMTPAARKTLARRWFDDVINRRDLDAIDDAYSEDYVHHGAEGAEIRGLDEVRSFAAALLAASADRRAEVHQQVVEGDRVVTHFTSRGTLTGPFRGRPPTGEPWITEGIVISRIEDGKIAEDWEIVHLSGLPPAEDAEPAH